MPAAGILQQLDLSEGLRALAYVVQDIDKTGIVLPMYTSQLMDSKACLQPGGGLKSHASVQEWQAELWHVAVAILDGLPLLIQRQPLRNGGN